MRILLTNDDGIRAPGILALHRALVGDHPDFNTPLGDVFVVAPETVQSATSHGVTFHQPLMARPTTVGGTIDGVAVDGRPADCVKLALSALWPERFGETSQPEQSQPDIVISGMNAGANAGVNIIYSGTVAAAIEAAFLGVPSIAVSLHLGRGRPLFDVAAGHARRAIEAILGAGQLERHECLNVNIPRAEEPTAGEDGALIHGARTSSVRAELPVDEPGHDPREMPPIRVCPMNTHGLVDRYERRESPAGTPYYWASGGGMDFHSTEPGTDVDLLFNRHITVTPLRYDMAKPEGLATWRDRLGSEKS